MKSPIIRFRRFQSSDHVRNFSITTKEYFQRGLLHGIKYIFRYTQNPTHIWLSRIIWITSCLLGASSAVVVMNIIRIRYQTTPTITTIETTNFPIWNIQFPAVTLCNINKVYEPATTNIREKLSEKGLSEMNIQMFLSRLASLISPTVLDASFMRTYRYLEELNYTTQSLMLELMQPCENLILHCMWLGTVYPCRSMFRVTMSPEGFCCSFNNKAVKSDLEINHRNKMVSDQLNSEVYRVAGNGEFVGLDVLLDTETEWYVSPRSSYYGISVLIHDADEFPETAVSVENVQPGEALSVAVVPSVVVSAPKVRNLDPLQRNCLFEDERQLLTSNQYTFASCVTECVVDTILEFCGCIPFYYPHLQLHPYSVDSRQCTLHDVNCLAQYKSVFASIQPPSNTHGFNESITEGMNCNCVPGCSEQSFELQTVTAVRDNSNMLTISEHTVPTQVRENTTDYKQLSTLTVYFKEISCIKYSRDLFMTWDAVVSNFGGLFGLCLGGSILSLIEMIYFFTMPLIYRFVLYLNSQAKISNKTVPVGNDMTQYGYLH